MEPSATQHGEQRRASPFAPRLGALAWYFLGVLILLGAAEERRFPGSRAPESIIWVLCASALALLPLAYGWWFRRSWARQASLLLVWPIALTSVGILVLQPIINSRFFSDLLFLAIPTLPLSVLVLWYLHRPGSKAVFSNTSKAAPRFTLLGLMGIVVVAALSLALLRYFLLDDTYYFVTAVDHAKRGDRAGAARQIQSIRSTYYYHRAWQEVALGLAVAGDPPGAIEAAEHTPAAMQESMLRDIAVIFADRGQGREFMNVLRRVKGPDVEAKARKRVASYLSEFATGPLPPGMTRPLVFEKEFGPGRGEDDAEAEPTRSDQGGP